MQKNKIKILILGFIGILIGGFGFYYLAEAAAPSVYVSPATLNKNVGETFDISVGVSPAGQKVCAVEGKLNLDKLSCQSILPTVPDGVSVQSWPSCSNLYFLLGIQGCTTSNKTLFTVNVRAGSAGTATANLTGVDIIGEGVSISSLSSGGSYTLTSLVPPTCSCTIWSAWQPGICGGGGCLASQRLQTRTRTCTPADCDIETESQCIEDSSCIPVGEEVVPLKEEVIPPKEEVTPPEKEVVTVPPEERVAGEGLTPLLLASLGEIRETAWMAIVVTLCLIGLVVIGIREWELARKKKKSKF